MDEKKEKQELREVPVYRLDSQGNLPGEAQPPEPLPEFDWDEAAESSAEQEAASQEDPSGFQCWLELAVKGLYYPPDRRKVSQELRDHFTDRVEDYRAKGHPMQEAYRLAVKSLGDPTETAALLRAVHKPWLFWCLRLARIALVLVLIGGVIAFLKGGLDSDVFRSLDTEELLEAPYMFAGEDRILQARRRGFCEEEASFGPYRVSFGGLSYTRVLESYSFEDGTKQSGSAYECKLLLRYDAAPWHQMRRDVVDRILRITDGQGREYVNRGGLTEREDWRNRPHFFQYTFRIGPAAHGTYIYFDTLPEDSDYLDILLEQGTEQCRLRVRLGPWEYTPEGLAEEATAEEGRP